MLVSITFVVFQMDDIKYELEEQRALAKSRLEELESLQKTHTNVTKGYERLKLEVRFSFFSFL